MRMYDWQIACDEGKCQASLIYKVPFECKEQKLVQMNELMNVFSSI